MLFVDYLVLKYSFKFIFIFRGKNTKLYQKKLVDRGC